MASEFFTVAALRAVRFPRPRVCECNKFRKKKTATKMTIIFIHDLLHFLG